MSEMLFETVCLETTAPAYVRDHLIFDGFRLISDRFGESIFPVNHRCGNATLLNGGGRSR